MPANVLTVDTLNIPRLLRLTDRNTVQRGQAYYAQRRVFLRSIGRDRAELAVRGSAPEPYRVDLDMADGLAFLMCDCPLGGNDPDTVCKHVVAAALAVRDYLLTHPRVTWDSVLSQAVAQNTRRAVSAPNLLLLFSLQKRSSAWGVFPYSLPAAAFLDPRADSAALLKVIKRDRLSKQAKPVRSKTDPRHYVNVTDQTQGALLLLSLTQEFAYSYYYSDTYKVKSFLPQLAGETIFQGTENDPLQHVLRVASESAQPALDLNETDAGLRIRPTVTLAGHHIPLDEDKAVTTLSEDPLWLLSEGTAFAVDAATPAFLTFLQNPDLTVPPDEVELFTDKYLLPLAAQMPLSGPTVTWEEAGGEPTPRLYLTEQEGVLQATLRFGYGDYELPYEKNAPETSLQRKPDTMTLVRIARRPGREEEHWHDVSNYGLKRGPEPGAFALRANVSPVDFLLHQVPRLTAAGFEIFGEEALTAARVNRHKPSLAWRVSSGIDWFDVDAIVSFGDQEVALKEIRRAVRRREQYVKLADGSIGAIPPEWLERYCYLFALADETDDGLRLSNAQAGLLDELLPEGDAVQTDAEFQRRRDHLRQFQKIKAVPVPAGFQGELRHYQKAGVDWLHFLHEYEFGGCLADDMGLGKTPQALAFLQSLRAGGHTQAASLLVLPRSLIFNWEREAARFTPDLRLLNHAHATRARDLAGFNSHDLILTTYGILLRDIEMLRQHRFHYVVLDEAQAIKNPLSQSARAARLLQAEHRLTLTGTPVENSPMELWSQFAFLNPGLLGSLEHFRSEFAGPIERGEDETAAKFLRKLVHPFLLRRTKDQVARDLPPRTERTLYTEMEPGQRKMYNLKRDQYRAQILGLLDEEGMDSARMKILEGLLRLRQICCHPRLLEPTTKSGSGKFEMLLETLDTLRAEGHKALVFSQFVQMLTLVREELDKRGIPYAYLDGKTKDRQARVDQFQTDPSLPFFLISLKAGGVGLNLTAASYVIHIDPWWNPAVEMQATDRTHRIGQDKPVFVYKMIARDSVEEKILQLQDRKRALVSQLISAESSVFKSLTRQDIQALFE